MKNSLAIVYIKSYIKELLPNCEVEVLDNVESFFGYTFLVTIDTSRIPVQYSFELIEDFTVAIEKLRNSIYYYTLLSKVRFICLLKLGEEGFLNNYLISNEFLTEKREWLKDYSVNVKFEEKFSKLLIKGLNELSSFLNKLLVSSQHNLDSIENEKISIDNLLNYYNDEGNLNTKGAETGLGFLKAAAICKLMLLEREREKEIIPRIKSSISKTIYYIVAKLRDTPFLEIKLPDCIHDYSLSTQTKINQSTDTTNSTNLINNNSSKTFDVFWEGYVQPKDYRDIFICHASEDKAYIVKPLLLRCIEKKITFWFDNAEIRWGDSLTAKINEGLRVSKYVLVILSNNFIQKNWPKKELEAALNLEFSSGITKVLPLFIGNKTEVNTIIAEYPILNNKLYLSWDLGIEKIIEKLIERLNV